MEWRGRRGSNNIEDRRAQGPARGGVAVGGIGALVLLLLGAYFGVDVSPMLQGGGQIQTGGTVELTEADREAGQFVSVVLADTEEVWAGVLPDQAGMRYQDPGLVLFSGAVQSACGGASAAMGPFYCPGDRKVYLDTDFFRVMAGKMGAGGDFAYAYVIAHEVGHHVQNLTGTLSEVNGLRARLGERDANRLSVATELQADCYAGIWARQASEQFGTIEEGDIDEAINAAAAVGDDTLMESAGRAVVPDAFTHGSAAERQAWFKRGFASGQMAQCDSFAALGN